MSNLLRRKIIISNQFSANYKAVKWIKGGDGQKFNTGVRVKSGISAISTFDNNIDQNVHRDQEYLLAATGLEIGSSRNWQKVMLCGFYDRQIAYSYPPYGYKTVYSSYKNYQTVTMEVSSDVGNQYVKVNGEVCYANTSTEVVNTNINYWAFCFNSEETNKRHLYFKQKVYGFKMFDNGVLVRDYIPVLRKIDNKIGMYDKVNNVFYENEGTGEFTYGEE